MGNKKKQSTNVASTEAYSSGVSSNTNDRIMSTNQGNTQSASSIEIKQEADIKPEPVSVDEIVDEIVDVPASQCRNARRFIGFNERDVAYYFDYLSIDEAKVEMKKECDEKKKEEPTKSFTDFSEEVMDGHPDQQPRSQGDDDLLPSDGDDIAQNTQNFSGDQMEAHKCNFCKYSTPYKSNLYRHLVKHTGEKSHGCDLCPKRFTQKQNLRSHLKVHIKEFLFHCSGCLQGFNGKDEKMTHEMKCKLRRYECHLCKESFGSVKTDMIRHMHVHSGSKPFKCDECPRKYTQKPNLKLHMKTHTKNLKFKCLVCRQGFSKDNKRKTHQRNCNGRNYECHLCKNFFGIKKTKLKSHMWTHSGEKPFQCKFCRSTFTQEWSLKRHMNQIHKKNY